MPDVPAQEWIPWPVSDSSVFLDRPPVRYEGDDEDDEGAKPPAPEPPTAE